MLMTRPRNAKKEYFNVFRGGLYNMGVIGPACIEGRGNYWSHVSAFYWKVPYKSPTRRQGQVSFNIDQHGMTLRELMYKNTGNMQMKMSKIENSKKPTF